MCYLGRDIRFRYIEAAISSRSPFERVEGPCRRTSTSSLSGLAVSGLKAIKPRIPGIPVGTFINAIAGLNFCRLARTKGTGGMNISDKLSGNKWVTLFI